ncbi:MAG: extracellular solute-binding protein [Firmicutes bacterium]|nr:extracellular solute-binding protein [Bacillota bacterium]
MIKSNGGGSSQTITQSLSTTLVANKGLFTKIKVTLLSLALVASSFVFTFSLSGCASRDNILRVLNWTGYLCIATVQAFEENYGLRVEISTFETNEAAYNLLVHQRTDFDVFVPSDYMASRLAREGHLVELNYDLLPNVTNYIIQHNGNPLGHFEDWNPQNRFAVPYTQGTTGIMFNRRLLQERLGYTDLQLQEWKEREGWGILWDSRLRGQIAVKDSFRLAFGVGALYANRDALLAIPDQIERGAKATYFYNSTSPENLQAVQAAFNRLLGSGADSQNPRFGVDTDTHAMVANEIIMNMEWSGQAVFAMFQNPDLYYFLPPEGANFWMDMFVIPQNARNVDAAHKFINWMFNPWAAASNILTHFYTTTVDPKFYTVEYLGQEIYDYLTYFLVHSIPNIFGETNAAGQPISLADPEFYSNYVFFPHRAPHYEAFAILADFTPAQDALVLHVWNVARGGGESGLNTMDIVWLAVTTSAITLIAAALILLAIRRRRNAN